MGRQSTADMNAAWEAMQTNGLTRKEVLQLLGYNERTSAAGVEALFEAGGMLTWTDETGKLHAFKKIEEKDA